MHFDRFQHYAVLSAHHYPFWLVRDYAEKKKSKIINFIGFLRD